MSRPIDADALIKDINYSADMGGALGKVVECVKYYAKYMVASAPTIKPKRGKWIPQDHNKRTGHVTTTVYYYPKCSECGYSGNYGMNFCPSCGADMREGEPNV